MNVIANQEHLTAKLHRYEGSTLCEEILLPMALLPQACDFAGAKWKMSSQQVRGPEGTAVYLSLELVEGTAENVALCAEISFPAWGTDRYLVCPGVVYAGNRFDVRPMAYPPILTDPFDIGVDQPPRITDVLRLEIAPGKSEFHLLAGAMAVPAIGVFDPTRNRGLLVLTRPFEDERETSYKFAENDHRTNASLEIVTPGVRQKTRYAMATTKVSSGDRGADLMAGDSLELHFQI
ncbi:MAG: hypothetical protein ACOYM3_34560, partial [Terrimicrobiaceae bacterium]